MAEETEGASASTPTRESPDVSAQAETAAASQSEARTDTPQGAEPEGQPAAASESTAADEKMYLDAYAKWAAEKNIAPEDRPAQPSRPQTQPVQDVKSVLSRKDQELLARFHIKPSVVMAMNEDERRELLDHLREQRKVQDQLYQELQQLKAQASTAPPGQPAPTGGKDYRKIIEEYSSPEFAEALEAIVAAKINPVASTIQQQNMAVRMLERLHYEQGLDDARKTLGDTVDLDDEANRQKLMQEAARLFQANHDPHQPWEYTIRDAIAQAARSAFVAEMQLAEQRKLAASQQRAIRGSPDTSGRPSSRAPNEDIESLYERIEEAQKKGASLEELTAMAQRGLR